MIIISIFALGVSSIAVSAQGSYVKDYINLNNVNLSEDSKMVPVKDDSFDPVRVDKIEPKIHINNTNISNNTPNLPPTPISNGTNPTP
jgi:hypothetical protein